MARIVRQESETVEFKERWTDSALEALAAFAKHKPTRDEQREHR